jgi:ubiquinone biosynthesis protein COQ9
LPLAKSPYLVYKNRVEDDMQPEPSPEPSIATAKSRLLAAALVHVPFDGWSDVTLRAAVADSGLAAGLAAGLFPRGGIDLAVAYHKSGDQAMRQSVQDSDLSALKFREKVAYAVRRRLELVDKEAVRRGVALFALPQHGLEGAALIWGTADTIWTALGDASRDINWYSKRATLSAVYSATVLYWLGDHSDMDNDTWAFLDRRIENVMQFEKIKAGFGQNPVGQALARGPLKFFERISAPMAANDLPGRGMD